nr:LCP family protein [Cryobacterium sp. BB736]
MTKRAWWLVALNLLIPGSAQLLAGNRRLGKFGVSMTFLLWFLAIAALITYWVAPRIIFSLISNPIALTVAQVLLAGYAVLWVVLTLDTLRLVQFIRTKPNARLFVALFAIIGLVATAGVAGYGATVAGSARSAITSIFDDGAYVEPSNGRYNIMLLGGDAGPDREGLRPDSISLASVDAETGATVMVGIPRNMEFIRFSDDSPLWGPFPDGYNCGDECLISYLYTYGEEHPELYPDAAANGSSPGIEAMRDAVGGVLNLDVQFYALIDMEGFSQLIDSLGGVTINVPARTPIGPITAPEPFGYIEAGEQAMDGATALWYARSRFDSNDFERMARQRQVQEAMLRQFTPANVLARFEDVAAAGTQVVRSDIPSVMLGLFVDLASKSRELPLVDLELVPPEFNPAAPDYGAIEAALADAFVQSSNPPSPPPQ